MRNLIVGFIVISSLSLFGCSKKDDAAPAAGGIGVAECDEYISKYSACIGKMPAAAKGTAEQGLKAQTDAWKTMAATPDGKTTLKTMCKPTLEALATNPLCK